MSCFSNRSAVLLGCLLLCLGVLMTACGAQHKEAPETETKTPTLEEKQQASRPQSLVFGVTESPDALLPERTSSPSYSVHARSFTDGLLGVNPHTNELVPSVAEDWQVSEDGKRYTFYLKKGVQWQRGYGEVTAEDVAFTFDRHIDPTVDSVHADRFWMLDRVEVVDTHTVRFHLNTAFEGFLSNVAIMHPPWGALISKRAFQELGAERYSRRPVGCGPYVLKNWVPGEKFVYERFEDYFKGKPHIKQLEVRLAPDEEAVAEGMQAGDIDMAFLIDPTIFNKYRQLDNLVGKTYERIQVAKLAPNTQRPPLDRREVRWALAHAVDTRGLIDHVLGGQARRPNCNILHPALANVNGEPFDPVKYSPEKVREWLARVDLEPADLHLKGVTYNSPIYRKLANFLNSGFQNAGLDVTVVPLEEKALQTELRNREYDFAIISHPRWPDPDPFFPMLHDTYNKEETEQLTALQERLCHDMSQVPLWHRYGLVLLNTRVKGFQAGPGAYFNPYQLLVTD